MWAFTKRDFPWMAQVIAHEFLAGTDVVDVGEWHAMNTKGNPLLVSHELRNLVFEIPMPHTMEAAVVEILPNMPWAEDQFQERVGGLPLNPGETYKTWPWQSQMDKHVEEVFSHTYMERYWPKWAYDAGEGPAYKVMENSHSVAWEPLHGIRYPYGDLQDVVSLLARSPYTRQAVLPVWFPEDTGAVEGQRVPCSLSYQWLLRDGKLHCTYTIRSCDFMRHFRDDVYHTIRLSQWVLEQLREEPPPKNALTEENEGWRGVQLGDLVFQCGSMHIFEGDMPKLRREYGSSTPRV